MADEDPFDVFSDDEEDSAEENEATRIARSLMEQVNLKLQESLSEKPEKHVLESSAYETPSNVDDDIDLSHFEFLELPWPPPLYKGPVSLVRSSDFGGGRGYVASKRLQPGTLVLVETPMFEWPKDQLGEALGLVSIRRLLEHSDASQIIQDMEDFMYSIRIATLIPQQELLQLVLLYFNCWILTIFEDFHPTKDQVDDSNSELEKNEQQITKMMEMLQSEYVETQISELVQLAKENEITSRNSCFLTAVDILRLLLSLRYNGLETGVYRHVAMLNHNCHPNCSKLLSGEVRTTKTVHPGEFLTISYLPHIMSHSSRRKHIWEQHRFDIGASLKGNDLKMELIGTSLPKSSIWHWDETSLTRRVEKTVEELQNLLDGLCLEVENGRATPELWETAKALEQSSLELYTESTQQLKNTNHILLLPCLSIHLEACDLMQKAPSFSVSIHLGILSRQALTAIRLLSLQALNLGPDHFDLARTNLDIANAVGELLSRSPKHLYDLNVPILRSFQDWSAFEHKSRKEYDRIKALYPHDVGALIKQDSHQL